MYCHRVFSILVVIFSISICMSLVLRSRALAASSRIFGRSSSNSLLIARIKQQNYFSINMPSFRGISTPRRSARLATALEVSSSSEEEKVLKKPALDSTKGRRTKDTLIDEIPAKLPSKKKSAKNPTKSKSSKTLGKKDVPAKVPVDNEAPISALPKTKKSSDKKVDTLGRPRENKLKKDQPVLKWVMGIDEAGRGPLAGPVVAAAAIVPCEISGITDSKKITCEDERERLYEEIIASPNVSWAVAVVDAICIDDINILQATMTAMSMAASAMVIHNDKAGIDWEVAAQIPASTDRMGCYVTCGGTMPTSLPSNDAASSKKLGSSKKQKIESEDHRSSLHYYALVDGNRLPQDLPCEGEFIIKGDSKEYSIAAASILAKVTRDRLMHSYDKLYPDYQLAKHKGYPTKDHMAAVGKFGASPIHRRTFAPLKHMLFDDDGKIIGTKKKEPKKKK